MSNALLLHCKETYKQSNKAISAASNVTPETVLRNGKRGIADNL